MTLQLRGVTAAGSFAQHPFNSSVVFNGSSANQSFQHYYNSSDEVSLKGSAIQKKCAPLFNLIRGPRLGSERWNPSYLKL